FAARAVGVGDVDAARLQTFADRDAALRAVHLGRRLHAVRERARHVDHRELAAVELDGGDAVVDVAAGGEPAVHGDHAGRVHALRPGATQQEARAVDI